MRCEIVKDLLVQRRLGDLSPAREGALERHLASCDACRRSAAAATALDDALSTLHCLPELPPQRAEILSRLPAYRRRRFGLQALKGATAVAAVAAVAALSFQLWTVSEANLAARRGVPEEPPASVVAEGKSPSRQAPEPLPATFFEQIRPGAGWVATAPVPTPGGTAAAYYFLEPLPGDQFEASLVLRRPDGRLTRDLSLGPVSFGRLAFTQPELQVLRVGEQVLLAVVTENAQGAAELRVAAYDPEHQGLVLIAFDATRTALPVSAWPMATPAGIRTQSGSTAAEWRLTENGTFRKLSEFEAPAIPAPAGSVLARADIGAAAGPLTAQLEGSRTDGATLRLYRPDGSRIQEIDLGGPHFGSLGITSPALHVVRLGDRELVLILSDPIISQPQQAVLRVFAFDPGRGQLRPVPFATGEVLVEEVPQAEGGQLWTRSRDAGPVSWRLTDHWLLEPIR